MKQIITFLFSLVVLYGYGQGEAPIRVSGHVNDSLQVDCRWAYLFINYGKQGVFIDSTKISGGRFDLKGSIPYDEVEAKVIIDRIPTSSGPIVISRGDQIMLDFPPIKHSGRPLVLGSKVHEELYSILSNPILDNRERLIEKMYEISLADPEYKPLKDSIDFFTLQQDALWKVLLSKTSSGFNAIYAFKAISPLGFSEEERNRTGQNLVTKFYKNINIPKITNGKMGNNTPEPQTTSESKAAFNHYARIIGNPLPFPDFEISDGPKDEVAYQRGDQVADFGLPAANCENIMLSDIHTDYVLIDFWASRSIPDLVETNYRKSILEKYPQSLTVLTVSIDENLYDWLDAIAKGEMEPFLNVILRSDNPEQGKLTRLFDIAWIPKNFLLDKERRIVAVNLRGEELEKNLKKSAKK
jgi:hypothetical protein